MVGGETKKQWTEDMKKLLGESIRVKVTSPDKKPLNIEGVVYYYCHHIEHQGIGIEGNNKYIISNPRVNKPGWYLVINYEGKRMKMQLPMKSTIRSKDGGLTVITGRRN